MHIFRKSSHDQKQDPVSSTEISPEEAILIVKRGDEEFAHQHYVQAINLYEQTLSVYTEAGDQFSLASTLGKLGNAHSAIGDQTKAIQYYEQALKHSQSIDADVITCSVLGNLGLLAQHRYDHSKALSYFLQALEYARKLSDTSVLRFTLNNIANTLFEQGDYEQAIVYLEQCLEANRETDNRRDDAVWLSSMAVAHAHLGRPDEGKRLLAKAHDILKQSSNPEAASDIVRVEALITQLAKGDYR
jgi:tetratricopeptide (TPR) repeat protein